MIKTNSSTDSSFNIRKGLPDRDTQVISNEAFHKVETHNAQPEIFPNALPDKKTLIIGSLCITIFVTAFVLLWWNKYLGITNDGWHFFHAQRMLNGEIPYRDFYLFIPPLHPLRLALEIKLFGNYLIVPQIFGLLERLILFVVLFIWLARFFPVKYACIGVIAGAVFYLADYSETLSSLHHEAVFFPTLAAFSLSAAYSKSHRQTRWLMVAGFFAGLAFLGKQTSGLGITAAIPGFLIFADYKSGWRLLAKKLAAFAAAFILPVGMVFSWLAANHAFSPFIEQIFLKGPTSKGSLAQLLIRPIAMTLEEPYMRRTAFLALAIIIGCAYLIYRSRGKATNPTTNRQLLVITTGAFLSLGAGIMIAKLTTLSLQSYFAKLVEQLPMYISQIGILAMLIYIAQRFFRGKFNKQDLPLGAFVFCGAAIILTLSFSWSVYVSMIIPALPFLIALALTHLDKRRLTGFARFGLLAGCALLIMFTVAQKLERPYNWAHWIEPSVEQATVASTLPELRGIQMSPLTRERVERITQLMQTHASETEPVFVYPHLPIFYSLSHRRPSTFASVHFFDVNPDYVARQDAAELLQHPPAVIVDFQFTPEQIANNEMLFRGGAPSGQRDIVDAIHQLTVNYQLLESYSLPKGNVIRVWAKKS
ncbi:MAG: glycosyltransferase family 39 protein [Acidobacteriota bacterium]